MALSNNRVERLSMLCAMYFAQGLPWGFMVTAVISYLTGLKQDPILPEEAANLSAMILLPWTFKLVWAPFIDTMTIRSMGRRRPWIIGAELMMAMSLLAMLTMGDLRSDISLLGWMFFLHNCFASLQDVCTDALAVDILPIDEQGQANGLMWGSKLVGKAVGASLMAIVMNEFGFAEAVLVQFVFLMLIMLFPIMLVERPGEKRLPWTPGQASPDGAAASIRPFSEVVQDLRQAFGMITTSVYFVFGCIHVIGWGIVEVITKPLYTKAVEFGGLGWHSVNYSQVAGAAVISEGLGALLGGWLADRVGRKMVIVIGAGGYGFLHILYAMTPQMWHHDWYSACYLWLSPGVLAMGSVGFLALGMQLSWTKASATMFTVYMTMSNVGHVIGNKLVGYLQNVSVIPGVDLVPEGEPIPQELLNVPTSLITERGVFLTFVDTFYIAGFAMLLPLLLLMLVHPMQVEKAKAALVAADDDTGDDDVFQS
ncbi:MAG: MFS transporter [Planctomycetota bacterium]|nr:MFS transporter [Planctomycetota bacterium]